ncbi:PIN domain-containing protein [Acinetobacter sp. NyZ410]|uniref:PIN domain-containing protein n=1 Tax=Acinetobacter sp. NyZ410 TaxID=2929509 RepID=UPI001FB87AA4|nr:PIN domain-containing protein [Acinetobacter sp. NyZ410]UOH17164.1 hypothetical protein MTO68_15210 [Acinetobacter sp. NyZ410]
MIVAIDNCILVSLVSERAVYNNLETFLHQNNATLLIPTPVIAEFIAIDHNNRRNKLLTISHNKVLNGAFDKKTAFICGELASKLDKEFLRTDKQKVKVDLQIIAIALANNAEVLLSEDRGIINAVKTLELNLKIYKRDDLKIGLDLFDKQ